MIRLTFRPTGTSGNSNFTAVGAATTEAAVSDQSDSSYIRNSVGTTPGSWFATFSFADVSNYKYKITKVVGNARSRLNEPPGYVDMVLVWLTTNQNRYTSDAMLLTNSFADYSWTWTTNPYGNTPWTFTSLNNFWINGAFSGFGVDSYTADFKNMWDVSEVWLDVYCDDNNAIIGPGADF